MPLTNSPYDESRLWRAVLGQAIRDIYDNNTRVRSRAIAWIETPDFPMVCDYADVEPDSMREQLVALANLSLGLARKYGQALRSEVTGE